MLAQHAPGRLSATARGGWPSAQLNEAIAARDAQAAQFPQQGIPFREHTFYHATEGDRLFLIAPIDLKLVSDTPNRASFKPHNRRT